MKVGLRGWLRTVLGIVAALSCAGISPRAWAEAPGKAVSAFDNYAGTVEARLAQQHKSITDFLANVGTGGKTDEQLRRGEVVIEKLTPDKGEVPGGLLHDWRGTAFVKGARAEDFERLMKNFTGYPRTYSPQVVKAEVVAPRGEPVPDHFTSEMRVKQKHMITVVLDSTYDVRYSRRNPGYGWSISRSTKISEIEDAGTAKERVLPANKDHGYLWRLNTYWSYEERDGGLYMQLESISLTRGIPTGLGWMIGPFVESVPRESLEFTLEKTRKALER